MGGGLEVISTSDFGKSQIALACWRAAKNELHPVMLSVGLVFRNRSAAKWYEGDLYENAVRWLVENPGEFPDLRDPEFTQLLLKLDAVTSGLAKDTTDGAMYFCPKQQLPENLPGKITATMGQLVFIR